MLKMLGTVDFRSCKGAEELQESKFVNLPFCIIECMHRWPCTIVEWKCDLFFTHQFTSCGMIANSCIRLGIYMLYLSLSCCCSPMLRNDNICSLFYLKLSLKLLCISYGKSHFSMIWWKIGKVLILLGRLASLVC